MNDKLRLLLLEKKEISHMEEVKALKDDKAKSIHITREDFDLLDFEEENITYYITEEDGTITVRKGEN